MPASRPTASLPTSLAYCITSRFAQSAIDPRFSFHRAPDPRHPRRIGTLSFSSSSSLPNSSPPTSSPDPSLTFHLTTSPSPFQTGHPSSLHFFPPDHQPETRPPLPRWLGEWGRVSGQVCSHPCSHAEEGAAGAQCYPYLTHVCLPHGVPSRVPRRVPRSTGTLGGTLRGTREGTLRGTRDHVVRGQRSSHSASSTVGKPRCFRTLIAFQPGAGCS
jgi:hypothetical protein